MEEEYDTDLKDKVFEDLKRILLGESRVHLWTLGKPIP
jgi:hypothetical protein